MTISRNEYDHEVTHVYIRHDWLHLSCRKDCCFSANSIMSGKVLLLIYNCPFLSTSVTSSPSSFQYEAKCKNKMIYMNVTTQSCLEMYWKIRLYVRGKIFTHLVSNLTSPWPPFKDILMPWFFCQPVKFYFPSGLWNWGCLIKINTAE